MSWNNGYERKKFERKLNKDIKEYKAAGMTDEQINAMIEFDEEVFRSERRYRMHNQEFTDFEDEDGLINGESPMFEKYSEELSTTIEEQITEDTNNDWIEKINNYEMYCAIQKLSEDEKEIISYLLNGANQDEIANQIGISQPAISKKIKKIKKIFVSWL